MNRSFSDDNTFPSNFCILQWASWQIRKIAGYAYAGNAGNVSPRRRLQMKPLVSDPGMHHDTCVTHVPWCMSGSLFRGGGENVPGILGACATRNFTYLARGPLSIMTTPLRILSQVAYASRDSMRQSVDCNSVTLIISFIVEVEKITEK